MDKNRKLSEIKQSVKNILPGSRVILFGSRALGNFDQYSDYDILVITGSRLSIKQKRKYAGRIRKQMAVMGMPVDVLVKTEEDVSYYKDKIGSVVRDAVRSGVAL